MEPVSLHEAISVVLSAQAEQEHSSLQRDEATTLHKAGYIQKYQRKL
jgi:hypothetical protein